MGQRTMPKGTPFAQVAAALTSALRERDGATYRHCARVLDLATELGQRMGLRRGNLAVLQACARLHDVGKIGIPDRILLKPGPLTHEEYAIIKTHSTIGANIIAEVESPGIEECIRIIRHHHERLDGTGYPDGLSGRDIPLGARIIGLVDAYDAITSHRSYHGRRAHETALDILRSEAGSHFDPVLVEHFLRMLT